MTNDTGSKVFGSFFSHSGTKNTRETEYVTSLMHCTAWLGENLRERAPFSVPLCILSHLILLYLRISLIHSDGA